MTAKVSIVPIMLFMDFLLAFSFAEENKLSASLCSFSKKMSLSLDFSSFYGSNF